MNFQESLAQHANYPANLLQPSDTSFSQATFLSRLGPSGKERLFQRVAASVQFISKTRRGTACTKHNAADINQLKSCLGRTSDFNFVRLHTDNAKRTIHCAVEMFTYLMSFYQVRPIILDYISAFARFDLASESHNTGFHGENSSPDERLLHAGYRIQQWYCLRYLQQVPGQPLTWQVEQLIVYHCYEAATGRALWITANSSDELDERIEALISRQASSHSHRYAVELATATHLALCEWCDRKWQDFVDTIHRELDDLINKVQTIKLGPAVPCRPPTGNGNSEESAAPSHSPQGTTETRNARILQQLWNKLHGIFGRQNTGDGFYLQDMTEQDPSPFEFSDIQGLYRIKDILGQALLVSKINVSVLSSLGSFYKSQDTNLNFVETRSDLLGFSQKASYFEKSMRIHQARLETIAARQNDGKALMDDIATFRNLQFSRFFAESSMAATRRGEILAQEAGQNSTSMHIITIITLVFLPATFITTFMQSGIFLWESEELHGRQWLFKPGIFVLFLTICLILTAITFAVWVVGLCHAKAKAQKRFNTGGKV